MSDLEAILEGTTETAEPESVTEPEQTPEPEQAEESVEADDKGAEEQSQEADASEQSPDEGGSPTPDELAAEIDGLKKALKAERSRRQAAETKKEKQPAPDVFESQEAFVQHMEAQMQEVGFNERANLSEFMARREFPDMDARIEKFQELKDADPTLAARVLSAVSPYHEIADIVEKAQKLEQLENVDEVEARMRAEVEAKVRAEYEEKAKKDAELREKLTPSLSGAGSKSGIKGHDFSGPTPLTNLLPD